MKQFKKLAAVLAFALTLAVAMPCANVVTAQAAKTVTANPNYKKAPVIKKTGTVNVKAPKNHSMIAFRAPKAGTYKFTISNIATMGSNDTNLGNWYPKTLYVSPYSGTSYLQSLKVKTEGGKQSCLWTASANYRDCYTTTGGPLSGRYLKTRSATVKLKAGQTIWFDYYYTGNKCTYKVTIKKK